MTTLVFCTAITVSAIFYWRRVGVNLGLSSLFMGLLFLFHGPAYLYYTRIWGPDTEFFGTILSAAPGADVIGTLDIALSCVFLFVPLGIVLTDVLSGTSRRQFRLALSRWTNAPPYASASTRKRIGLAAGMSIIVLLAFVVLEGQLARIYSYSTSSLGEFEKIFLRRELGSTQVYVYNILLGTFFPFVAFCLLASHDRFFAKSHTTLLLMILLVAISKAATLSKAPLAVFLIQLLVVHHMRTSLTVALRMFLGMFAVSTGLFVMMAIVANPTLEGIVATLEFLFYRVFMIVNEGLLEYFAAIPHVLSHTWGMGSSFLAALFQTQPVEPNYWLVAEVHRGNLNSTTTVMFMGDAWADYSWAGVVSLSLAAGAIMRWLDVLLIVRRGKTPTTIAGLALGHYGIFIALSTALQTAMVTGGLLLVIPFVRLLTRKSSRSAPVWHRESVGQG